MNWILKCTIDAKILDIVNTTSDGLQLKENIYKSLLDGPLNGKYNSMIVKKCNAVHIRKKNIDYEYSLNGVVLESV